MKHVSNAEIAKLLRSVAAALTLKKANQFQIRAYENAADAIEHSTTELQDLWEEKKLAEVPGLGEKLRGYLSELFKTGQVRHFHSLTKDYPSVLFQMLDIPGIGPKTALDLTKLGVKSLEDLEESLKSGKLVSKGFSAKQAENILAGITEFKTREGRMLLPMAVSFAARVISFLKKSPDVIAADPLGSLRRQVATVGDLDFSAASKNPQKVLDYFIKMPGVVTVVEKGVSSATVVLNNGLHLDLLVGQPETYGALLQHFTGSKHHNIHLRTLVEKKHLSLSEYGVRKLEGGRRKVEDGNIIPCKTEKELYQLLGMQTPPPEIREDTGEIEAALKHQLPKLIEAQDLQGDLHLHSNYPFDHPSHGPGVNKIEEIIKEAKQLGYKYVGISDHPPAFGKHTPSEIIKIVQKRTKVIQEIKKKTNGIQVLNGLEIDILNDGNLSVPDEALNSLDYCIAGIHGGHRTTSKDEMTKKLLKALSNPNVDIISHPTGRLINERPSFEADWEEIFKFCAKNEKLLEINASPNRLDLRDDLVRRAKELGVKFLINSDAHEVGAMKLISFGVSVGRRGWLTKGEVVNSWSWEKFAKWFGLE